MTFRQQIETLSGQNVNLCFQCSKCSAGCPVGDRMDLKPAQIMHSIRLGRKDAVLHSEAIWLCVGCETCSARCPQQVEPAEAINAARILARQEGVKPAVRDVGIFYSSFVGNLRLSGRIHDVTLAGITRLLSGHLIEDLPLGWKLLTLRRIKLPRQPLGGGRFRWIFARARAQEKRTYK
jgi:heterodisulfide reductase subunit C